MKNLNFKVYLLFFAFFAIIAPIGIETSSINREIKSFTDYVNFIRLVLPIIIFIIILTFTLLLKKEKFIKIRYLFFYFIFVFLSTIVNLKSYDEIHKLLLPLNCINYLLLITISFEIIDYKKFFNKFFFFQFLIILIVTLFSLINFYYFFFNFSLSDLYNQTIENNFYNQNSNGLSRIIFLISIFIFMLNVVNKYYYLSLIVINTTLVLLQSKFILFCLYLVTVLMILKKNEKFLLKLKKIILILIVPIIFSITLSQLNQGQESKQIRIINELSFENNKNIKGVFDKQIFKTFNYRFDSWKEIIYKQENFILGHGSQADRILTKNLPNHTQLASNAFVYALSASGILGFVFFILFYFDIIKLITKYIKNKFKKNKLSDFYLIILIFLLIRSFIENSFAVWGVDFILIVNCIIGLNLFQNKLFK